MYTCIMHVVNAKTLFQALNNLRRILFFVSPKCCNKHQYYEIESLFIQHHFSLRSKIFNILVSLDILKKLLLFSMYSKPFHVNILVNSLLILFVAADYFY